MEVGAVLTARHRGLAVVSALTAPRQGICRWMVLKPKSKSAALSRFLLAIIRNMHQITIWRLGRVSKKPLVNPPSFTISFSNNILSFCTVHSTLDTLWCTHQFN
jgi:hypothetical protein